MSVTVGGGNLASTYAPVAKGSQHLRQIVPNRVSAEPCADRLMIGSKVPSRGIFLPRDGGPATTPG